MFDAREIGGEFRALQQLRPAEHFLRETLPFAIVLHADQHGFLDADRSADREGPVRRDGRMGQAHARPDHAGIFVVQQRHRHPVAHGIEQRDMNGTAGSGAGALQQGFEDGRMGVHAGGHVARGHADTARCFRGAGDRRDAALGLDQQVVRTHAGIRTRFAITRDIAGNQARMALAHGLPAEAGTRGRAGAQVLDQHVGLRDHALQQCGIVRIGEVENDRFLAAVQPHEIGTVAIDRRVVATGEVALGAFDLDHARAGVGEPRRCIRRGGRLLHRHHQDSFQGQCHVVSVCVGWRAS